MEKTAEVVPASSQSVCKCCQLGYSIAGEHAPLARTSSAAPLRHRLNRVDGLVCAFNCDHDYWGEGKACCRSQSATDAALRHSDELRRGKAYVTYVVKEALR